MADAIDENRRKLLDQREKLLAEALEVNAAQLAALGDHARAPLPARKAAVVDADLVARLTRLPLTEAVTEDLNDFEKQQTIKQVTMSLKKAGRNFGTTTDPFRAVKDALKEALVKNPDLAHVGFRRWYLISKQSDASLKRLEEERAGFGTGGRARSAHIKRTRKGMEKARKKGRQIGAVTKGTPELYALIREKILGGATIAETCAAAGISAVTFNTYRKNKLLGELPVQKGRRKLPPIIPNADVSEDFFNSNTKTLRVVK